MRLALEPGLDPAALKAEIEANQAKVKAAGGLFVIGTERHESRRIDNQLRGRSGRQGDPGASRFFLSLEDDLMRIFGSDRMGGMLQRLGLQEGEAIIHPWINKALEKAQKKVEIRNFDMRKNVLKYDDVMNDQRKEVYAQRREFMRADSVADIVAEMREDVIATLVANRIPEKAFPEQWQSEELAADLKRVLALDLPITAWAAEEGIDEVHLRERIEQAAAQAAAAKAEMFGPQLMAYIEKSILLQTLDHVWKEHLLALDYLRQGIGLRGYGQRDPLNEYKREAFAMFAAMLDELKERVTTALAHVMLAEAPAVPPPPPAAPVVESHPLPGHLPPELALTAPVVQESDRIGPFRTDGVDPARPETWGATPRNAPCPCGSGKKYKYCHGRV
jgi:preprotein translocase subunit SecA